MVWFRKDVVEELLDLIKSLGIAKLEIDKSWEWRNKKLKSLKDLEEIDIKIIRDIQILHKHNRDNPELSARILYLASKLKKDIENLVGLVRLSKNIPKIKIELAKRLIVELEILLAKEIKEERVIPGMTLKQIKKLGIKAVSFYTVLGKRGLKRIMHGKGDWPISPTKAHLGPGLYAWNNLETAQRYKRNLTKTIMSNDEPEPKLFIVRITFSETSIKKFKPFDVDLLDNFKVQGAQEWMDKHSSLWTKRAKKHDYKYVIRGVSKDLGKEHYFIPECLLESTAELIA